LNHLELAQSAGLDGRLSVAALREQPLQASALLASHTQGHLP
jgi:hypothetical protein